MELIIRPETEKDYYASELTAQRAFWNLHHPGCNEHYLVFKLRTDPAFIPELTHVAEHEGKVVGLIMYAHSYLLLDGEKTDILSFGPLCVEPEFQKQGVGGALLEHTLELAKQLGHKAVMIYGEPDYYPLHGFSTCDRWGITTPDGRNFSAFMGKELVSGSLSGFRGARFFEPPIYDDENLPPDEVDEYSKKFPYLEKKRLPGQWPD